MEKRTYYISIGYCGRLLQTAGNQKYGYGTRVIPVVCTKDELDVVAKAVGEGYLADSCTVSLTEEEANDRYSKPYAVYWDCM